MLQFCSVSNSTLTHNPFNKVRGMFFLKNCVRSSLLCWICFCIHLHMSMQHHYLFGDKIIQICVSKISQEVYLNYQQKSQIYRLSTQSSIHRVSKQPQQEGITSKIRQKVDYKMPWQCEFSVKFYWKESEKVPPTTFPRTGSFRCTVG